MRSVTTAFLTLRVECAPESLPRGEKSLLVISLGIPEGYHIQAHKPDEELLVPTNLVLRSREGLLLGEPLFPEPEAQRFEWSEVRLLVYRGKIEVAVPVEVVSGEAGPIEIAGTVSFQGCTDARCLPPAQQDFALTLEIM